MLIAFVHPLLLLIFCRKFAFLVESSICLQRHTRGDAKNAEIESTLDAGIVADEAALRTTVTKEPCLFPTVNHDCPIHTIRRL